MGKWQHIRHFFFFSSLLLSRGETQNVSSLFTPRTTFESKTCLSWISLDSLEILDHVRWALWRHFMRCVWLFIILKQICSFFFYGNVAAQFDFEAWERFCTSSGKIGTMLPQSFCKVTRHSFLTVSRAHLGINIIGIIMKRITIKINHFSCQFSIKKKKKASIFEAYFRAPLSWNCVDICVCVYV